MSRKHQQKPDFLRGGLLLHPRGVLLPAGWRLWDAGLAFSRGGDHRLRRPQSGWKVLRPCDRPGGAGTNVRKPGIFHVFFF